MDFKSLNKQRNKLEKELARLEGDLLVEAPSIVKLVEMEINRLMDVMQGMALDEVHKELTIEHISNVFNSRDAESLELLRNWLTNELKVLNFCFHPPLRHIASFIPVVVQRLEQKILKELSDENLRGVTTASQQPKAASVGDSQSQVVGGSSSSGSLSSALKTEGKGSDSSPQPNDAPANKNLECYIDYAVATKMQNNPQDFCVDLVTEFLRGLSKMFGISVDDEDVSRLIIQKCNEALVSAGKKLAQGDQGDSGSKQD